MVFTANTRLYLRRFFSLSRVNLIKDADWYTPAASVAGGAARAFPPAPAGAERRFAAALDYAAQTQTFALLVWRKGQLALAHYAEGVSAETRFSSASMHKTVLALLYGAALRDGMLPSLDIPAATWLTEWKGKPHEAITIRHLLEMRSGLEHPPFSPVGRSARLFVGTDLDRLSLAFPVIDTPGEVFDYNNVNSELAGLVLQRAVGQPYADYLARQLWGPLQAADAEVWLDRPGGRAHTALGLQARAEDWLRLGLLLLDKGRVGGKGGARQVIPAEWIEAMLKPSPLNPNYGMHIWLGSPHAPQRSYGPYTRMTVPAQAPFAADDVAYLDGSGGQRVYVIPSRDTVIVRFGGPNFTNWDDSALPNLILDA